MSPAVISRCALTTCKPWGLFDRTVHLPVFLFGVLLQVCCEEDILWMDALQLLGHLVGRRQEVDVAMDHIRRVLVFFAA